MNYLGLKKKSLKPVVDDLNQLLAEFHLHYQKLRNFHWNIKGNHFFELHAKFEELYNASKLKIDAIAERILSLQHTPVSSLREYINMAEIPEVTTELSSEGMIRELLNDHVIMINKMREIIAGASEAEDEGTIDLIGGYLEEAEKTSWMLNAYLNRISVSKTDEQEQRK